MTILQTMLACGDYATVMFDVTEIYLEICMIALN